MKQDNLPIIAIIGRTNVGKSSLFNRLLGERKAVVSDMPGTTRDRVQGVTRWNGKSFWLIDTAGFERADNELEISMQAQLKAAIDVADVIMIVIDSSTILSDEDSRIIKDAYKSSKPLVVAANKSDRKNTQVELDKLPAKHIVPVSAIHGTGSGDLLDVLVELIPDQTTSETKHIDTVALLGRPNVGKSSLLNVLAGEERAIVSDQAGTTRDASDVIITHKDKQWRLYDTAGLRRTAKRSDDIERFSALRTLRAINDSDVCILVIDAEEPAVAGDQRIAGMIRESGKGILIAANKWDLTSRDEEATRRIAAAIRHQFQFIWWAPLLMTSATTKHNVFKMLDIAGEVQQNRQKKLTTRQLNKALEEATGAHPPAGLKNKHPKLRYITQTEVNPPTFTVFGKDTPYLHWSYKRYLESRLREEYDFAGTPLRFKWRENLPKDKSQ